MTAGWESWAAQGGQLCFSTSGVDQFHLPGTQVLRAGTQGLTTCLSSSADPPRILPKAASAPEDA